MSRVLPRTSVEATYFRAEIFKKLPPLFTPWFELKMLKLIHSGSANVPTERDARTLVEIADALLLGLTMPAMMLVMGRLKALTDANTAGSGGWSSAQHYELTGTSGVGILSQRDRANARRDQRDAQRVTRGAGMPPREPA